MKPTSVLAMSFALGLAACGSPPSGDAPAATNGLSAEDAPSSLPDADINASLDPLGAPPSPLGEAGSDPPRFVGRWAAEEGMCATAAWEFGAESLRTPAGSACRFTEVRQAPGGYDVAARCTAEGPEQDDVLEIRFAESARAMLFESQSIADTGLVRCTP
jgi:hypothetical protein